MSELTEPQLRDDNMQALREAAVILEDVVYHEDPRVKDVSVAPNVRIASESWLARWTPIKVVGVYSENARLRERIRVLEKAAK